MVKLYFWQLSGTVTIHWGGSLLSFPFYVRSQSWKLQVLSLLYKLRKSQFWILPGKEFPLNLFISTMQNCSFSLKKCLSGDMLHAHLALNLQGHHRSRCLWNIVNWRILILLGKECPLLLKKHTYIHLIKINFFFSRSNVLTRRITIGKSQSRWHQRSKRICPC